MRSCNSLFPVFPITWMWPAVSSCVFLFQEKAPNFTNITGYLKFNRGWRTVVDLEIQEVPHHYFTDAEF